MRGEVVYRASTERHRVIVWSLGGGGCSGGWLGLRDRRDKHRGRDYSGKLWKVWKLASVPADRTAWDRPVDGRREGKKVDSFTDGPSPGGRL
jgi:hypothetical protein